MLCVQCCHIFSFSPKSKEKKNKTPGSISHFCLLRFFSSCASAVTPDDLGRETVEAEEEVDRVHSHRQRVRHDRSGEAQ